LYAKNGDNIADVTYGRGVFWKKIDTTKYKLVKSDIKTGICLTKLPYDNESKDMVVLDPPYAHNSTVSIKPSLAGQYNLYSVCGRNEIIKLYSDGILEAHRVLKNKAILVVKCQDEIMSGKQWWNHIEIMQFAFKNGFIGEDLLILVQKSTPTMRHNYQLHARKNHSYFIVLRKMI